MNIYILGLATLHTLAAVGGEPPHRASADAPADTVPVTLEEAVAAARAAGPGVLPAHAAAEAASAQLRVATSPLLPSAGLEAGWMRTDDPVGAFGTRMRQGRFTQSDFDPARLNHPDAIDDITVGLGIRWSALDLSSFARRRAAALAGDAAELDAAWAERYAAFSAEVRYLEAVGAARLLDAARTAEEAARANLARIQRRVEEGLLTEAEALRARAEAERAAWARTEAERTVADARARLALAMGWEEGRIPVPVGRDVEAVPEPASGAAPGATPSAEPSLGTRPDLEASALRAEAARAEADAAARGRLPRVETFARTDAHTPDGTSPEWSWTLGVAVRVPLFTGFRLSGARQAASAAAEAAARAHDERLRAARTELESARRAVEAARRAVDAAQAADAAAQEAARLYRRRFEEGLATTADLLAAEAAAARAAAERVRAELGLRTALATLRFLGGDA